MKTIIHLPNDEKLKEFQIKIASIQADAILSKLNSLKISTNDKKQILKGLKQELE